MNAGSVLSYAAVRLSNWMLFFLAILSALKKGINVFNSVAEGFLFSLFSYASITKFNNSN